MRYFSVKSAALALVSLGAVFLGTEAAPASDDKHLAVRAGGPSTWTPKPVPDVFGGAKPAYRTERTGIQSNRFPNVYDVFSTVTGQKVCTVGIKRDTAEVTVRNANNNEDKTPTDVKQSLSDIMAALYEKDTGNRVTELKSIKFDTVVEDNTKDQIDAAYAKLGKQTGVDSVTVNKDSTGQEKEAFDIMSNSLFVGGTTEKMIKLFSIPREVYQLDVTPNRVLTVTLQ